MRYYAQVGPGPATYTLGNRTITLDLLDGETSESRSAEALAALYALMGRTPPPGVRYRPSPAPEKITQPVDPLLQKNLLKAEAAPRIMARWTTYNEQQLLLWEQTNGEQGWDPALFNAFMSKIGPITIALFATAFSAVKAQIMSFDDPLATPEAKAAYLAAMDEETK